MPLPQPKLAVFSLHITVYAIFAVAQLTSQNTEEEHSAVELASWNTTGSEKVGQLVAKRFLGKMFLGQVLDWKQADQPLYLVGAVRIKRFRPKFACLCVSRDSVSALCPMLCALPLLVCLCAHCNGRCLCVGRGLGVG